MIWGKGLSKWDECEDLKMRTSSRWSLHIIDVLIRGSRGRFDTDGKGRGRPGRDWGDVTLDDGGPQSPQIGRGLGLASLQPAEGAQLPTWISPDFQFPDSEFGLLTSATVSGYISVVSSHQIGAGLSQRSQDLIHSLALFYNVPKP